MVRMRMKSLYQIIQVSMERVVLRGVHQGGFQNAQSEMMVNGSRPGNSAYSVV
jgi:hypothetical protein